MEQNLVKIGRNTEVEIVGHATYVPAKVDTGADSSSVWATNIYVDPDHTLHYTLFGKVSAFYTGQEISTKDFKATMVTNSTGHKQIRYRVRLSMKLEGRRIRVMVTLADRSRNTFPILIGRRTLHGKFIVDVSINEISYQNETHVMGLNEELQKDPHAFHKKYYGKSKIK
jgi:hypothetical protein